MQQKFEKIRDLLVREKWDELTADERQMLEEWRQEEERLVVFVVASCVAPFPMPALLNPYVTPCITSPAINPKATADAANFATYFPLPPFLFFLGLEWSFASSALH